jgi:copper homeostasis protein CutC
MLIWQNLFLLLFTEHSTEFLIKKLWKILFYGFSRILTSAKVICIEGVDIIAELIKQADGRIVIVWWWA